MANVLWGINVAKLLRADLILHFTRWAGGSLAYGGLTQESLVYSKSRTGPVKLPWQPNTAHPILPYWNTGCVGFPSLMFWLFHCGPYCSGITRSSTPGYCQLLQIGWTDGLCGGSWDFLGAWLEHSTLIQMTISDSPPAIVCMCVETSTIAHGLCQCSTFQSMTANFTLISEITAISALGGFYNQLNSLRLDIKQNNEYIATITLSGDDLISSRAHFILETQHCKTISHILERPILHTVPHCTHSETSYTGT